ncbi:hypothetical protein EX30DRAFT_39079 [Ascodesmis nigricans]|uniref:Uncharacterized protein n=1 Tax=Ascodesmis nigricans TaxID=341454 RepID=A0A4S2MVX8_9PEZI|nr:hypothetical protein EX30DRAFT_39079 [Ascodesmis nigricans]
MAQEDHGAGGGAQDHHLIGPTTAETEEFYAYQRQHPGMTKNELADWFMDKYKKAVELRRRRSDQPSDLEYMVIKKRAKYRERIPEGEMTELLKYATHNPDASYRQIADHFQSSWNRSIDPNTVQSMLDISLFPRV